MNLRKQIIKKFGSVSAFIKASGSDQGWVYRTLQISEDGPLQIRSRQSCDQLTELIEKTPLFNDPDKVNRATRERIDAFFRNNKIGVQRFAEKYGLQRTMIYQVIRGERVTITDKVKQLLKAIEDYESLDRTTKRLQKNTIAKGTRTKKTGVHNASA